MDEKNRFYEIKDLESNSEYVLSLRARNLAGDGEPAYYNIQTRDEDPIDSSAYVLEVPVRLRAITMSATSIVVYWTDNSASRSSKFYTVRYNTVNSARYKYYNTTELNGMIDDLRPSTQYEFAVKAVSQRHGHATRRESAWSMSEVNTTFSLSSISPPRDLVVKPDLLNPQSVLLRWLPPRNNDGQINGYTVYYTTDSSNRDRDWSIEPTIQETAIKITDLKADTLYYFKVQAQNTNRAQPGIFSAMVSHRTGSLVSLSNPIDTRDDDDLQTTTGSGLLTNIIKEYLIYIIGGVLIITLLISIKVVMIICRPRPQGTPDGKHNYNKGKSGNQPPDLWIHHDQMELKKVEKNPSNDGASSSGAMTLPRAGHEYEADTPHTHITSSLDKRQYVPGYMCTCLMQFE